MWYAVLKAPVSWNAPNYHIFIRTWRYIEVANSKSAAKRDRQSKERRMRNRMAKSTLRSATRKFNEAVAAQDSSTAGEELQQVVRLLDKFAGKRFLHRNTAARKKSRLHAQLKSIQ